MFKAFKIALLYWLQQALRGFCPHPNNEGSRRCYAPVCPTCALRMRVDNALSSTCGMQALYQLRKCELCREPLSKGESDAGFDVHSACAERENARAEQEAQAARHGLRRDPEHDLPF
jgi:predicted amidophosphoribosyltransferase